MWEAEPTSQEWEPQSIKEARTMRNMGQVRRRKTRDKAGSKVQTED